MEKQLITFYNDNEYIDNIVYRCDSEIINETDNFIIVKKSNFIIVKKSNFVNVYEDVKSVKNIVVIITYFREKDYDNFLRGYIYFENKEYEIDNFTRFASKQIGKYGYDNIGVCYLSKNIFVY
jgi:hypothetical protein